MNILYTSVVLFIVANPSLVYPDRQCFSHLCCILSNVPRYESCSIYEKILLLFGSDFVSIIKIKYFWDTLILQLLLFYDKHM